ncbi:acyl-CoA dehydrogenase family member 10 [Aphelenchoides avenae]|nr:acyl-CoA dehydrogenase family member 10 [Aphelenchus avenae]
MPRTRAQSQKSENVKNVAIRKQQRPVKKLRKNAKKVVSKAKQKRSAKMTIKFKAVVFDMGGVVVEYAQPKIIHAILSKAGEEGKNTFAKHWMDWELGRIDIEELTEHIKEAIGPHEELDDIDKFLAAFLTNKDENIDEAIKGIKAAGLKVALLTNNGYRAADKKKSVIMECLEHFDVIVESCRVGLRKPDPEIYKLTAEKLGVKAEECIFLDDLIKNCEGAEAVLHGETDLAVKKLEELLKLKLHDEK